MSRSASPPSWQPTLVEKVEALCAAHPDVAAVIEALVDSYMSPMTRRPPEDPTG